MSEPIHGTKDFILKKMLSAEIDIKDILVNKGLSILQASKIAMYEFANDYVKPNIDKKQNYAT